VGDQTESKKPSTSLQEIKLNPEKLSTNLWAINPNRESHPQVCGRSNRIGKVILKFAGDQTESVNTSINWWTSSLK
jgi:hypothetical protein